jgi:DNA gyrase/topoisomerase IV subunit A
LKTELASQYLLRTSRDYSIYVCQERAIPSVIDGLKHVQRMALWLLRDRAEKIKTVALGGLLAFEKLYIHGDVSANNAIGFLAAPYMNNVPLIEGHGHFGSKIFPSGIGAPRYTEIRRAKAAEALLYRDLNLIPLEPNYDGSNEQPRHFLPLIPLVLLNGVSGIAVGWSTNILPRDLKALIEATKAALLDKPLNVLVPSFNKYAITVNGIGTNRWEFIGKAKVLDATTIHVTELPPGLDIESFRKRLIMMEENDQIQNFTDRSTENIDITVKMKRRSHLDGIPPMTWSDQVVVDFFKLRERVTERIVVVDWDGASIRTYSSAEQLVIDFAAWRLRWYKKRFEHLKEKNAYELKYWQALRILFEAQFPARLGRFENRAALQDMVRETLDSMILDDVQLDRVVNLPTYRWTVEFSDAIVVHIAELTKASAEYDDILASSDRLRDVYLRELDELKGLK